MARTPIHPGEILGDELKETVAYRLPPGKRAAVAAFSGMVEISEDGEELSARSGDERLNFLARKHGCRCGRAIHLELAATQGHGYGLGLSLIDERRTRCAACGNQTGQSGHHQFLIRHLSAP